MLRQIVVMGLLLPLEGVLLLLILPLDADAFKKQWKLRLNLTQNVKICVLGWLVVGGVGVSV